MVEIWLIFNLFIPFAEVLLHTYMDTLRWESLNFDFAAGWRRGARAGRRREISRKNSYIRRWTRTSYQEMKRFKFRCTICLFSNISQTSFQLGFSGSAPALQGCQNEEFEKCCQTATDEVFQRLCCPCHPLRLNLDNFCSLFFPVFTLVYFGIGILHAETV